jgi:DNA invertase Pin-like site-specific DNA recombinase
MTTRTDTLQTVTLQTGEKAAVYPRSAHVRSQGSNHELQKLTTHRTDVLLALAHQHGFLNENLIVYEDIGIRSSSRIDQREGLRALVQAIEQDDIKTVFLLIEDSLFKNADVIQVNAFIELCKQHQVYIVTLTHVYDFENPQDVQLFRLAIEAENYYLFARTARAKRTKALRQIAATIEKNGKQ